MGTNFGMEYPTVSSFFEVNGDFPENVEDGTSLCVYDEDGFCGYCGGVL